MRGRHAKILPALLLTLAVGIQLLEVSGRWDRTLDDAGDEACIVAVVLCIGIAVATAATLLVRLRNLRVRHVPFVPPVPVLGWTTLPAVNCRALGPPTILRI